MFTFFRHQSAEIPGSDSELLRLRSSSFHCRNNFSSRGTSADVLCALSGTIPYRAHGHQPRRTLDEGLGTGSAWPQNTPKTCPGPCARGGSVSAEAGRAGALVCPRRC